MESDRVEVYRWVIGGVAVVVLIVCTFGAIVRIESSRAQHVAPVKGKSYVAACERGWTSEPHEGLTGHVLVCVPLNGDSDGD